MSGWNRSHPSGESFAWAGPLRLFVFPPVTQTSALYRSELAGKWEWLVQDRGLGLHGRADTEKAARLAAVGAAADVLTEGLRDCTALIKGACAAPEE